MSSEFDYIIVGAGSAGCVLANLLSADKDIRVLLVEAGGHDRRFWVQTPLGYGRTYFDRRINWNDHTQPDPGLRGRSIYWPRGRLLGGSSSINAMVYHRGLKADYDDWARAGNPLWSAQAVYAEFDRLERITATDGRNRGHGALPVTDPGHACHAIGEHFLSAARDLELPLQSPLIGDEGLGRYCMTIDRGRRCSSAAVFLHPALKRPNLKLLRNTQVERVLQMGTIDKSELGLDLKLVNIHDL